MPGKKKKSAKGSAKTRKSSASRSRSPSGKRKGKKSAKGSAKSRISSAISEEKPEPDMLNPVAMENLYFIAHGVPEALGYRGFNWPEASKKKGKGKKKKK